MKAASGIVAVGVFLAASAAYATSGAFVQGGLFASIELSAHSINWRSDRRIRLSYLPGASVRWSF